MRQRSRTVAFLLFAGLGCLCLIALSACALPQQIPDSATIRGRVVDSSGALLAEVQITLRNPSGAITAKTATDSNGQFVISGIGPGPYTLEAERKKFETARRDILVSVATPLPDLEIIMKVAGRTETVNVFQPEGYAAMATTVATKTDTPFCCSYHSPSKLCLTRFFKISK